MNKGNVVAAVHKILDEISPGWEDSSDLAGTPGRVASMYEEMTSAPTFDFFTTETNEGNANSKLDQIVLVKDIEFTSMCKHHLLPFYGVAAVAYIPGDTIAGISKLARTVQMFARQLQLQERMTHQIGIFLEKQLKPVGTAVIVEAEHLCMRGRGVRSNATTSTSFMRGAFRTKPEAREELMLLLRRGA